LHGTLHNGLVDQADLATPVVALQACLQLLALNVTLPADNQLASVPIMVRELRGVAVPGLVGARPLADILLQYPEYADVHAGEELIGWVNVSLPVCGPAPVQRMPLAQLDLHTPIQNGGIPEWDFLYTIDPNTTRTGQPTYPLLLIPGLFNAYLETYGSVCGLFHDFAAPSSLSSCADNPYGYCSPMVHYTVPGNTSVAQVDLQLSFAGACSDGARVLVFADGTQAADITLSPGVYDLPLQSVCVAASRTVTARFDAAGGCDCDHIGLSLALYEPAHAFGTCAPSATPSALPSPAGDADLVLVELLSNILPLQGDGVPALPRLLESEGGAAPAEPRTARKLTGASATPTPSPSPSSVPRNFVLDVAPYPNATYGGFLLSDQEHVSLRFTASCSSAPCTLKLAAVAMVLQAAPAFFLPPDAHATLSFRVQLGRYYTNVRSTASMTPCASQSRSRQLTNPSPSPNYAPYVDFQSTIWTAPVDLPASPTLVNISLAGLQYTLWGADASVAPGDLKLVVTPYIHYDRSNVLVASDVLACSLEQVQWLLTEPVLRSRPVSAFVDTTGFDAAPACLSTVNGVPVPSTSSRVLTSGASGGLFPPGCSSGASHDWRCVGIFPSIRLTAELPASVVKAASPLPNTTLPCELPTNTSVRVTDCLSASSSGPLPAAVDTSASGRFISTSAIRTSDITGAAGGFDLLFVFPPPCTRCTLALRNLWLPLAAGEAACGATATITATVGLWTGARSGPLYDSDVAFFHPSAPDNFTSAIPVALTDGMGGPGNVPPQGNAAYFLWNDFLPSAGPNGLASRVSLTPALRMVSLTLGNAGSAASVDVPSYSSRAARIAVRLQADTCMQFGLGLTHICTDATCLQTQPTPVGLFQHATVAAGTVQVWALTECPDDDGSCSLGAYLPALSVKPLAADCSDSSADAGSGGVLAGSPAPYGGAEHSVSTAPVHASGSCSPTRSSGSLWGAGASTGSLADAGLLKGVTPGGIAGIVVGAVAAAVGVAVAFVFAISRHVHSRSSSAAEGAAAAPAVPTGAPPSAALPAAAVARVGGATSGEAAARRTPAGAAAAVKSTTPQQRPGMMSP
jgi:hypothetical protein